MRTIKRLFPLLLSLLLLVGCGAKAYGPEEDFYEDFYIDRLVLDLEALDYMSSAGLRVLLAAQKVMNRQREMIVRKVNETIMEVFEVTGFVDILTIE